MVPNQKKGVSTLLSTRVIVVLAIIMAIISSYLMIGLAGFRSGIEITINPKIYSPESNLGVLNEESVFNIYLKNYENYSQEIKIYLKYSPEL